MGIKFLYAEAAHTCQAGLLLALSRSVTSLGQVAFTGSPNLRCQLLGILRVWGRRDALDVQARHKKKKRKHDFSISRHPFLNQTASERQDPSNPTNATTSQPETSNTIHSHPTLLIVSFGIPLFTDPMFPQYSPFSERGGLCCRVCMSSAIWLRLVNGATLPCTNQGVLCDVGGAL